jgi:cell division transport system ATP-binding protein
MAAEPIIVFSDVSKRYAGGQQALSRVSFTVQAGEMLFLTGPSGAGKSTLLKMVAAIERPTSGTVRVGGQNIGALKPGALPFLRRKLGLVFQDQKLLFDRSVFDNVVLPLVVTGHAGLDAARRARAALEKVGLLEREKARPIALSGGEHQRLCIARAVVARPAILVADEPTSSLDPKSAREVLDIFRSFHQVGTTVLVSTHDSTAIEYLGPRLVSLSAGRIIL